MNTCKLSIYKMCASCGMGFCDNKWCGDLLCQRCLDICWILDDEQLCNILFTCCDYHRPQINFNNITSYTYSEYNTDYLINSSKDMKTEVASPENYSSSTHSSVPHSTPIVVPSELKARSYFVTPSKTTLVTSSASVPIPKLSKPIQIPQRDQKKKEDRFDDNPFSSSPSSPSLKCDDNNPFSQSLPQYRNDDKIEPTKSKSFIIAKSYEIRDDISNTFKKYIVDKIKNKDT